MAATSGNDAGFAKTGFVLGVEHVSEALRHFVVGLEVNLNWMPMDAGAVQSAFNSMYGTNIVSVTANSWLIVGVFGNVGFGVNLSSTSHFYGRGKVGLAFGNAPRISLQVNNEPVMQNSASSSAFAYGFGFGVIVDDTFDIGFHFLSSAFDYKVTTERGGISTISEFRQPSSVIQLRLGYSISLN